MAERVCPWWVGYLLASPLRRLAEDPEKLLRAHVRPGMTVLDLGSAMGFFSLPLAHMVGSSGRVVCLDVQERMLQTLRKRARRNGLDEIIETRRCTQEDLPLDDLHGQADLALAFHVVHETRHPDRFLASAFAALRPGGKLILVEPTGHVSEGDREYIFERAETAGFARSADLKLRRSEGVVFEKPA